MDKVDTDKEIKEAVVEADASNAEKKDTFHVIVLKEAHLVVVLEEVRDALSNHNLYTINVICNFNIN